MTSAIADTFTSFYKDLQILTLIEPEDCWKTRARVTPRAEEALTPDNFYN